ncbi:efflux RND transporter permease subunit [Photobacterium lutimaris]|uniref:AcrB/AcrD/AcrF family protein n=1 Tax=Photobacterium lutimaris TaxID=388278 RepID=A0A2T3IYX8_9GAMM|nr:efflux RND transporter permease subunit [Photobacterium lutimaris]PSU33844.1 AcrB/AcrD/AcrF family protein [Photobacterium lutimaris]TDR76169.1 multidrug efflux pump subunit AcrB [Photobacterium lutimaris]
MNQSKGAIAWMTHNRVTPNLLMLFFIIGGLLMGWQIKKEVQPNTQHNSIRVWVYYPGSTPAEMEQGITLPIENAINGIEGIKEIHSWANSAGTNITAELINNVDVERVKREIENAVNTAQLPAGAEKPRVLRNQSRQESMELVLYGDTDPVALRETSTELQNILLRSPELTQVEVNGFSKYEVQIQIDTQTLERYGLTLDQVARSISSHAVTQSGGRIQSSGGDILLQLDERRGWAKEFNDIVVLQTPQGGRVYLEDIADIRDGFANKNNSSFYNGLPSASIRVYRIGDQTPVSISEAVYDRLPELESALQPGMTLNIVSDDAIIFQQRMHLLLKNAFSGLLLVLFVLALFLDVRLAFWVTVGIPTSFLGSLLFLPAMDVSINMISMFAFIIALGIVVDDAIIAGENIHEKMSQGVPFANAAIEGAKEIATPLTFSILTNIIAFIPIWFLPGTLGMMFQVIPLVVACVFIISWVEALFILPTHLAHINNHQQPNWVKPFTVIQHYVDKGLQWFISRLYTPTLKRLLAQRYFVISSGVVMLMVSIGYISGGHLGFTTMPRVEAEFSLARAFMPVGTSYEEATEVRHTLEQAAMQVIEQNGGEELATGVSTHIRSRDGEFIIISRIFLQPSEIRAIPTRQVSRAWRQEAGDIPTANAVRFSATGNGPGADVAGVTVELTHRNNERLQMASEDLSEILAGYNGVVDIENSFMSGSQQIKLSLLPEGKSMGLNEQDLIRQVRHAFNGVRAMRQQRGSDEVDVKVQLPDWQRSSVYHLEHLPIKVGDRYLPLSQIASVEREYSASTIQRREGRRRVTVGADITPSSEAMALSQTLANDVFPMLQQQYPGLGIGFLGDQAEQKESLSSLATNGALVLLALYCLLAIPFRSYTQPLIIMTIIPFGIIGAVIGHSLLNYSLSIVSLLGTLALSGVVINDSLILVTEVNRNRERGRPLVQSILAGSSRRFRPIMLTTLTTFGGLVPMIMETSNQAQLMVPMAISLGFGILFATFITLVLLPCLYHALEDIKALFPFTAKSEKAVLITEQAREPDSLPQESLPKENASHAI